MQSRVQYAVKPTRNQPQARTIDLQKTRASKQKVYQQQKEASEKKLMQQNKLEKQLDEAIKKLPSSNIPYGKRAEVVNKWFEKNKDVLMDSLSDEKLSDKAKKIIDQQTILLKRADRIGFDKTMQDFKPEGTAEEQTKYVQDFIVEKKNVLGRNKNYDKTISLMQKEQDRLSELNKSEIFEDLSSRGLNEVSINQALEGSYELINLELQQRADRNLQSIQYTLDSQGNSVSGMNWTRLDRQTYFKDMQKKGLTFYSGTAGRHLVSNKAPSYEQWYREEQQRRKLSDQKRIQDQIDRHAQLTNLDNIYKNVPIQADGYIYVRDRTTTKTPVGERDIGQMSKYTPEQFSKLSMKQLDQKIVMNAKEIQAREKRIVDQRYPLQKVKLIYKDGKLVSDIPTEQYNYLSSIGYSPTEMLDLDLKNMTSKDYIELAVKKNHELNKLLLADQKKLFELDFETKKYASNLKQPEYKDYLMGIEDPNKRSQAINFIQTIDTQQKAERSKQTIDTLKSDYESYLGPKNISKKLLSLEDDYRPKPVTAKGIVMQPKQTIDLANLMLTSPSLLKEVSVDPTQSNFHRNIDLKKQDIEQRYDLQQSSKYLQNAEDKILSITSSPNYSGFMDTYYKDAATTQRTEGMLKRYEDTGELTPKVEAYLDSYNKIDSKDFDKLEKYGELSSVASKRAELASKKLDEKYQFQKEASEGLQNVMDQINLYKENPELLTGTRRTQLIRDYEFYSKQSEMPIANIWKTYDMEDYRIKKGSMIKDIVTNIIDPVKRTKASALLVADSLGKKTYDFSEKDYKKEAEKLLPNERELVLINEGWKGLQARNLEESKMLRQERKPGLALYKDATSILSESFALGVITPAQKVGKGIGLYADKLDKNLMVQKQGLDKLYSGSKERLDDWYSSRRLPEGTLLANEESKKFGRDSLLYNVVSKSLDTQKKATDLFVAKKDFEISVLKGGSKYLQYEPDKVAVDFTLGVVTSGVGKVFQIGSKAYKGVTLAKQLSRTRQVIGKALPYTMQGLYATSVGVSVALAPEGKKGETLGKGLAGYGAFYAGTGALKGSILGLEKAGLQNTMLKPTMDGFRAGQGTKGTLVSGISIETKPMVTWKQKDMFKLNLPFKQDPIKTFRYSYPTFQKPITIKKIPSESLEKAKIFRETLSEGATGLKAQSIQAKEMKKLSMSDIYKFGQESRLMQPIDIKPKMREITYFDVKTSSPIKLGDIQRSIKGEQIFKDFKFDLVSQKPSYYGGDRITFTKYNILGGSDKNVKQTIEFFKTYKPTEKFVMLQEPGGYKIYSSMPDYKVALDIKKFGEVQTKLLSGLKKPTSQPKIIDSLSYDNIRLGYTTPSSTLISRPSKLEGFKLIKAKQLPKQPGEIFSDFKLEKVKAGELSRFGDNILVSQKLKKPDIDLKKSFGFQREKETLDIIKFKFKDGKTKYIAMDNKGKYWDYSESVGIQKQIPKKIYQNLLAEKPTVTKVKVFEDSGIYNLGYGKSTLTANQKQIVKETIQFAEVKKLQKIGVKDPKKISKDKVLYSEIEPVQDSGYSGIKLLKTKQQDIGSTFITPKKGDQAIDQLIRTEKSSIVLDLGKATKGELKGFAKINKGGYYSLVDNIGRGPRSDVKVIDQGSFVLDIKSPKFIGKPITKPKQPSYSKDFFNMKIWKDKKGMQQSLMLEQPKTIELPQKVKTINIPKQKTISSSKSTQPQTNYIELSQTKINLDRIAQYQSKMFTPQKIPTIKQKLTPSSELLKLSPIKKTFLSQPKKIISKPTSLFKFEDKTKTLNLMGSLTQPKQFTKISTKQIIKPKTLMSQKINLFNLKKTTLASTSKTDIASNQKMEVTPIQKTQLKQTPKLDLMQLQQYQQLGEFGEFKPIKPTMPRPPTIPRIPKPIKPTPTPPPIKPPYLSKRKKQDYIPSDDRLLDRYGKISYNVLDLVGTKKQIKSGSLNYL